MQAGDRLSQVVPIEKGALVRRMRQQRAKRCRPSGPQHVHPRQNLLEARGGRDFTVRGEYVDHLPRCVYLRWYEPESFSFTLLQQLRQEQASSPLPRQHAYDLPQIAQPRLAVRCVIDQPTRSQRQSRPAPVQPHSTNRLHWVLHRSSRRPPLPPGFPAL